MLSVFVSGAIALHSATFGHGGGPIFLDNVVCTGNESNLAECQHPGIARSQLCVHSKDAGVICPGKVHNSSELNNTQQIDRYDWYTLASRQASLLAL